MHEWQPLNLMRCANCGTTANPARVALESLPCERPQPVASAAAEPAAPRRAPCAVAVISHNYGRYLAEALDSVLALDPLPSEIVVIDDASSDDTGDVAERFRNRGVQYYRIDARSVFRARQKAFSVTAAEFVICLDADDRLPPDYIAAGLPLFSDPRVGLVYSDMQEFGASHRLKHYDGGDIERQNYMHSGSLVRRDAWRSAIAQREQWEPTQQSHADWQVWREILRAGWTEAKSRAVYQYRRHAESMMAGARDASYYGRAGLATEPVQIVWPLSGRTEFLPRLRRWFLQAQALRDGLSLHVFDSSQSETFGTAVRSWLADLTCETSYVPLPGTAGLADLDRRNNPDVVASVQEAMVRLYGQVRARAGGEWMLIVEDDVLPPPDVPEALLRGLDRDVACVSGAVRSRWEPDRWIAWDQRFESVRVRGVGLEQVHGTGFGCLLLRRSVLHQCGVSFGRTGNFDHAFSDAVAAAGWRWLIDWQQPCDHGTVAA